MPDSFLEKITPYNGLNIIINFFAILLLLVVISANFRTFKAKEKENKYLASVYVVSILAALFEAFSPILDGMEGRLITHFYYFANVVNYLTFTVFGFLMALFVHNHFFGKPSKKTKMIFSLPLIIHAILQIVNLFCPFIFLIDKETNKYSRCYGFYFSFGLNVVYMIYIAVSYFYALKQGKTTRYFPLYLFLIPVVLGSLAQTFFSDVSVEWASISIGLVGVVSAINNEKIFHDELTGLYNRAFFDYYVNSLAKRDKVKLTGIMLDINDFKQINDKFGHDFGDVALKDFANQLVISVGRTYTIIRLSGDEFVVFLPSNDKEVIQETINRINKSFEDFNNRKERKYELFASLGYASYVKGETPEEFLIAFDTAMYREKEHYHSSK